MIANETLSSFFRPQALDNSPVLMEQSFALRYQVYCKERNFLPADDYPTGLERIASISILFTSACSTRGGISLQQRGWSA